MAGYACRAFAGLRRGSVCGASFSFRGDYASTFYYIPGTHCNVHDNTIGELLLIVLERYARHDAMRSGRLLALDVLARARVSRRAACMQRRDPVTQ